MIYLLWVNETRTEIKIQPGCTVFKAENWQGCHSLKGRFCLLFIFLFCPSFSSFLIVQLVSCIYFIAFFLALRFSWSVFSSISHNCITGDSTSGQLKVHYFCHYWTLTKIYLYFTVSYFWERKFIWLCLYCWARSQSYLLANFPWSSFHTLSNQLKPGFREII